MSTLDLIKFGDGLEYIPSLNDVIDCFNLNDEWNPSNLSEEYRHNVKIFVSVMRKNGLSYLDMLEAIRK